MMTNHICVYLGRRFRVSLLLVIGLMVLADLPAMNATAKLNQFFGAEVTLAQTTPGTFPAAGATNVPVSGVIFSATFDQAVTFSDITVKYNNGFSDVPGVDTGSGSNVAMFTPSANLPHFTELTVRVQDIRVNGVPYAGQDCTNDGDTDDFCWSFTTVPAFVPTLSFAAAGYQVSENAGQIGLTVSLDGPGQQPVVADYVTVNGTAVSGEDFTSVSGQLTWQPGETSQTITIAIANDGRVEGDEVFQVVLSNIRNAQPGQMSAEVTIQDDDVPLAVSISPAAANVPPGNPVTLQANPSGGTPPYTYRWDLADGSTTTTTEAIISHTYQNVGVYNVSVRVTDAAGNIATAGSTVTVGDTPLAAFTVDKDVVFAGDPIGFTNQSTGTPPLSYLWDFGDGTTSTDISPSHTFGSTGAYNVTLSTSNSFGESSVTRAILVEPPSRAMAALALDSSLIDWALPGLETPRFELQGSLKLPADHNPTTLTGPISLAIAINNQFSKDTVTLSRVNNIASFKEDFTPTISSELEIREVTLVWQANGEAQYKVVGQFNLPAVDVNTQPPNVWYSFTAPVKNNGLAETLGEVRSVTHTVDVNTQQWRFGP